MPFCNGPNAVACPPRLLRFEPRMARKRPSASSASSAVGPHLGDPAAAAGVDCIKPARRVVIGGHRTRLHRHTGDPLRPGLQPHDMRGTSEGLRRRRRITDLDVDADIVRHLIPQDRRAGRNRVGGADHHRQWLVGNVDQLGGILRRGDRLGGDERDRLADKARPIGRQRVMAGSDRRTIAQSRLDVGGCGETGIVRDRTEPGGGVVAAGQHREHPWCGQRRPLAYRDDTGMRMWRSDEGGMHLPR